MNQTEDGAKYERSTTQHALAYLDVADNLPHCTKGEAVLLDHFWQVWYLNRNSHKSYGKCKNSISKVDYMF
jgi:hypothetical protein